MSLSSTPASVLSARLSTYRHRMAHLPDTVFWKPKEGESLVGKFHSITPAEGPFGQGELLVLRTEYGLVTLWLTQYLRQQLQFQRATNGDLIGIRYEGKGTSPKGTQYNRYQVKVWHSPQTQAG